MNVIDRDSASMKNDRGILGVEGKKKKKKKILIFVFEFLFFFFSLFDLFLKNKNNLYMFENCNYIIDKIE